LRHAGPDHRADGPQRPGGVTDWGPAEWTGRRFDLSRATFEAIADLGAGVVDVKVDVIASR